MHSSGFFLQDVAGFLGGYYAFVALMNGIAALILWRNKGQVGWALVWTAFSIAMMVLASLALSASPELVPALPASVRAAVNRFSGPVLYTLGTFALPLGLGVNFLINGRDTLVPMAVEEPSVVAAVSNAARLARMGGGFIAGSSEPVMIGQVQLMEVPDPVAASMAVLAAEAQLAQGAAEPAGAGAEGPAAWRAASIWAATPPPGRPSQRV
jgi:hypothetical protein